MYPGAEAALTLTPLLAVLPHAESTQTKRLQADDVSLAYEFSKKVRWSASFLAPHTPCRLAT